MNIWKQIRCHYGQKKISGVAKEWQEKNYEPTFFLFPTSMAISQDFIFQYLATNFYIQ